MINEVSLINSFLPTKWKFKLKTHADLLTRKSNDDQACIHDTVDGRNPAPVDRQFIPLFMSF